MTQGARQLDMVWRSMVRARRKLVAVLIADVAGYTRLMEAQEERTHARLRHLRLKIVTPALAEHRGRLVKSTGDGFLATFDSAFDAVQCALGIQDAAGKEASVDPPEDPLLFRMGLHVADTIFEHNDIYGDGVNVAARLQTHAEPGGVVLSSAVFEQVGDRLSLAALDLGELHLRNLVRPIRAYSIHGNRANAVPATSPAAQLPSIAVLPFLQIGNGGGSYFAEGIIEGIIHVLASLKELFVLSQGSTLAYAGAPADPRQVGRDLGVRYVLGGSIQRVRERLRIRTELSDADTGAVIRADRLDGSMADLFDMQDRISSQVVASIAPEVREQELQRATRKHPDNMTSYDVLLQALDCFFRLDREAFARAGSLLQQAISHDPGYARARSYAALWHLVRTAEGWSPDFAADMAEMTRHSAVAVERDSHDALTLAVHGHALAWQRKYGEASRVLDRAAVLGPSIPMAWTMGSFTYGYLGDGPEAVRRGERGMQLSLLSPFTFWHEHALSQAHYIAGDAEKAVALGRRVAAQRPEFASNLRILAAALVALGRLDEAREVAARQLAVEPGFRLTVWSARTPMSGPIRDLCAEQLHLAGLPS